MKGLKIFPKFNLYTGLIAFLLLSTTSCTKDFGDINVDKNSITSNRIGALHLKFLFTAAVESVPVGDQTAENLYSQQYAQYIANNATYFPTDRYAINMGWARSAFNPIYVNVVPQLQTIFENTESNSAEYAMANIWWVFAFQRTTDYWGPIPYFEAGQPGDGVTYDSQRDIYMDFFERLKTSISVLKNNLDKTPFGGAADVIYKGKVEKWIKFANTLRLRYAVRISGVDPATAKAEAEAAVADGVFTVSPDDDALMERNTRDINKLSEMSEWFEFNMSAAMESILKGYQDPRISEYFLPAQNSGTYEGLRNGLSIAQLALPQNNKLANSHIGPRWSSPTRGGWASYFSTPQNLMCTAEAYFLRAEGVLLGWNMGGSLQDLYEAGIRNSMLQWGITDPGIIDAYIDGTTIPIAPGDYLNSPPAADVPVRFDASDIAIQKKQIAVQKWLALFPDGNEGWADYRRNRSVLPLYPVANSDNPDIPDPNANWIRRLPFLIYEYETNKEGVKKGVEHLNGPDKISTPLWWDVH
ncbi:MAG: SusD/RagB family nutrient-binding outer membrane lipoprotein [Chitinophagaceae bacterium]|nr:SusD/RagB family nutrient-binding outer membrane lipoprotein [Chitinophagaceae bacterium]